MCPIKTSKSNKNPTTQTSQPPFPKHLFGGPVGQSVYLWHVQHKSIGWSIYVHYRLKWRLETNGKSQDVCKRSESLNTPLPLFPSPYLPISLSDPHNLQLQYLPGGLNSMATGGGLAVEASLEGLSFGEVLMDFALARVVGVSCPRWRVFSLIFRAQ